MRNFERNNVKERQKKEKKDRLIKEIINERKKKENKEGIKDKRHKGK